MSTIEAKGKTRIWLIIANAGMAIAALVSITFAGFIWENDFVRTVSSILDGGQTAVVPNQPPNDPEALHGPPSPPTPTHPTDPTQGKSALAQPVAVASPKQSPPAPRIELASSYASEEGHHLRVYSLTAEIPAQDLLEARGGLVRVHGLAPEGW